MYKKTSLILQAPIYNYYKLDLDAMVMRVNPLVWGLHYKFVDLDYCILPW